MGNVDNLWKLIEKGRKGENIGISTGMPKLDKVIGKIQPSRFYLIGAGTSVGKTAFALFMLYNMLKSSSEEKPIYFLYFSLEIGYEVLLSKLMSLYCAEEFGVYLTTDDILSFDHPISDSDFQCLEKAREWLDSVISNITIIDKGLSARVLYKEVLKFAEKYGKITDEDNKKYIPNNPQQQLIIMIDHLNLARQEEGRSKKEEIDLISGYIVTLKRFLKASFIGLQQHNRESSSMDRRKADMTEVGLSDFKETAVTQEDSDCTIQLFYPFREKLTTYRGYKILGEGGMNRNFRSAIVSKNRYGKSDQVIGLAFWGSCGWWNELPKAEEIDDFTKYHKEEDNIPCKKQKIRKTKDFGQKEPTTNFNFSF